jgi:hypothetical protein
VPEPDRIATRVAEDLAVAGTLTAIAHQADTPVPIEPTSPSVPPTDTPPPDRSEVPTLPPPSDPTVPGFGNTNGLSGTILLPGYPGAPTVDTPVFDDRIVFRLFVFDPAVGDRDGDGIISVGFSINDPSGHMVASQNEGNAAYCAFDSDAPSCAVWNFSEHENKWPDGTPVCNSKNYQANMSVQTANSNKDGAFWGFHFSIKGAYPACP